MEVLAFAYGGKVDDGGANGRAIEGSGARPARSGGVADAVGEWSSLEAPGAGLFAKTARFEQVLFDHRARRLQGIHDSRK